MPEKTSVVVQMGPVAPDERALLGDELADQMIVVTMPPADFALAEIQDGTGQRCFAVQLLVVFPPDIVRLPRIFATAPGGAPVLPEHLAKAFASATVRLVMREEALTAETRAKLAGDKLRAGRENGPPN